MFSRKDIETLEALASRCLGNPEERRLRAERAEALRLFVVHGTVETQVAYENADRAFKAWHGWN
jgi:hypothetical protein